MLSYTYVVQMFDLSSTVLEVIMRERDTQRNAASSIALSASHLVALPRRYQRSATSRDILKGNQHGRRCAAAMAKRSTSVTGSSGLRMAVGADGLWLTAPTKLPSQDGHATTGWSCTNGPTSFMPASLPWKTASACHGCLVMAAASPSLQAARATAGSMPRSIWIWFDFA